MKATTILCGTAITGAIVTSASAALGASHKKIKQEKQKSEIVRKIYNNFLDSDTSLNKVYHSTMDSLSLKSQYEKTQHSLISLKKDLLSGDDKFRYLTRAT